MCCTMSKMQQRQSITSNVNVITVNNTNEFELCSRPILNNKLLCYTRDDIASMNDVEYNNNNNSNKSNKNYGLLIDVPIMSSS